MNVTSFDDTPRAAAAEVIDPDRSATISIGNVYGEQSLNNEPLNIEALYAEHRTLLQYVGERKFRIPDTDCDRLIRDVLRSFCNTATKVENVRAWLVAAMCNASRHYWRERGGDAGLPEPSDPSSHGLADQFAMRTTVRQALEYLQPRCREVIWLHYFEGRSAAEIARELDLSASHTEHLIHNCLRRVREIYMNITSPEHTR